MSQTEVANALGVTFQQVQKYERGTNRVGASRLFDLSRILSVPIQYFFAGLNNQSTPIEKEDDNVIHLMKPDTVELVEAYYKVENRKFGVRFYRPFVRFRSATKRLRQESSGQRLSISINRRRKSATIWPVLGASLSRYPAV